VRLEDQAPAVSVLRRGSTHIGSTQILDLPGAAAFVPKKDLQNPVKLRPYGQADELVHEESQLLFLECINSRGVDYTLFQAVPAVDNMFREELLSHLIICFSRA